MKIQKSKAETMVFENELMVFGDEAGTLQKYDDSVADKLITSSFLPRLQLMTGNSKMCKEDKFPVNKFALISGQRHDDIGAEVDVLVLVWRPKAIDTAAEEMIVVHDVESTEFQRIQEASSEKDSGCMFGQEFLVFVPSVKKFATFFMGTKTSRREAPNMLALLQKAATLKPGRIETKKYTYFSPVVVMCSTEFELPDKEECLAQIKDFNDPKVQQVERVEKDKDTEARG